MLEEVAILYDLLHFRNFKLKDIHGKTSTVVSKEEALSFSTS